MSTLSENWLGGFRVVDDGRTSVANYVWDTGSLSWVVQTGGGAGPSSDVNVTNASLAVTGTFWQATQPVSGTFWQATQPVSGTFWQATQPVSLASTTITGSVAVTGPLTDAQLRASPVSTLENRPSTCTRSSVASTVVDTLILTSNANRRGATIYNDSTAVLYLALGTTAVSATDFTVKMVADAYYEVPFAYTGEIRGLWASATGAARIGEIV